jgi:hypothetical protein
LTLAWSGGSSAFATRRGEVRSAGDIADIQLIDTGTATGVEQSLKLERGSAERDRAYYALIQQLRARCLQPSAVASEHSLQSPRCDGTRTAGKHVLDQGPIRSRGARGPLLATGALDPNLVLALLGRGGP